MFDKSELQKAIKEIEKAPTTFDNAHKLSTLYSLYDREYSNSKQTVDVFVEEIIGYYGDTVLYKLIDGKNAESVWKIINELFDALEIVNPRLYDAVIRKLSG